MLTFFRILLFISSKIHWSLFINIKYRIIQFQFYCLSSLSINIFYTFHHLILFLLILFSSFFVFVRVVQKVLKKAEYYCYYNYRCLPLYLLPFIITGQNILILMLFLSQNTFANILRIFPYFQVVKNQNFVKSKYSLVNQKNNFKSYFFSQQLKLFIRFFLYYNIFHKYKYFIKI